MKKILFYLLWIGTSILLVVFGAFCMLNPEITITTIAIFLGLILLISGVLDILTYVDIHKYVKESAWILMEGIITILLGILCLCNHFITAITIPVIFTIWILFAGVSRIVSSFDYKEYKIDFWWILFILGILLVILGIISLFEPIVATFAIDLILGTILISQGISTFVKGYYINRVIRKFTKLFK